MYEARQAAETLGSALFGRTTGREVDMIEAGLREAHEASAEVSVCRDISMIMAEYRKQEAEGCVDTPGGLEHMGDVWRQLAEWDAFLANAVRGAQIAPDEIG